MEKSEIGDILIEAINKCANDEGWANLAKMGAFIRKKGIKYGRLSRLLAEYTDIVEIKVDDSIQPPVAYARSITSSP